MRRMGLWKWVIAAGVSALAVGCEKKPEPPKYEPREPPKFKVPTAATRPAGPTGTVPAGVTSAGGPLEDPPIRSSRPAGGALRFAAPNGWVPKPRRPMTVQVYALPKVEGELEDADLAVSHFPEMKNIPLARQIERWCAQFEQPDGRPGVEVVRQWTLEGGRSPTTIIDICGRYRPGPAMGRRASPRERYRMLAAEIRTDAGPWYVKLIGPEKTVSHWKEAFLKFVSAGDEGQGVRAGPS